MAANFEDEEQGARSRNAASEASVPLLLTVTDAPDADGDKNVYYLGKFYVRKVFLEEQLKFISEGHDAEQRQARRRQVFANLIATSHK